MASFNPATLAISGVTELGLGVVDAIFGDSSVTRTFYYVSDSGSPDGLSVKSSFTPQVVVEEESTDKLILTDHPVEQGAAITDHAYKLPSTLTIKAGWSSAQQFGANWNLIPQIPNPSYLQDLYTSIRQAQQDRKLLTVQTGKRVYSSMLLEEITVTTDEKSENILMLRLTFREIITVSTQVSNDQVQVANPSQPQSTAPTSNVGSQSLQSGQNYNPSASTSVNPGQSVNSPSWTTPQQALVY